MSAPRSIRAINRAAYEATDRAIEAIRNNPAFAARFAHLEAILNGSGPMADKGAAWDEAQRMIAAAKQGRAQ